MTRWYSARAGSSFRISKALITPEIFFLGSKVERARMYLAGRSAISFLSISGPPTPECMTDILEDGIRYIFSKSLLVDSDTAIMTLAFWAWLLGPIALFQSRRRQEKNSGNLS